MAVTSITKRWQGRGATTDEKGVRTLKKQWLVATDDDSTTEPQIVDAVIDAYPFAELYAAHPAWPSAVCRMITAEPFGGPRQWLVDAQYSSAPFPASGDGSGGEGGAEEPTPQQANSTPADQRPPKISITRKEITEPLEYDVVTGERIENTVGDPFDPAVEVFRSHHLITWKFFRTRANLNWATRSLYLDSVNDASYTILGRVYPAYSLRVVEYSLDTVWDTGSGGLKLFFELTCQLEYNPKGWKVKLLNAGYRKWVGSMGDIDNPRRRVEIVDRDGSKPSTPQPLDAAGENVVPAEGPFHYVKDPDGFDGYTPLPFTDLLA
jgi:hypothetical protein